MRPTDQSSLGGYAEANAQERLRTFEKRLLNAAKHPRKAEPIHDLRVSIRRLTQVVRTFEDLFGKRRVKKMRRQLDKLMDRCGEARNCDIAKETLETANGPAPKPVAPSIEKYLRKCRSRARAALKKTLQRWKSENEVKSWRGWLRIKSKSGVGQDIPTRASQALRPLLREFLEASDLATRPEATPRQIHKFRLAGKRLRYSLEIFEAAAGSQWKQGIAEIQKVQDHLGAINDCVTTLDLLADAGDPSATRQPKIQVDRLLNTRLEAFRRFSRSEAKNKAWWNGWLKPGQDKGERT